MNEGKVPDMRAGLHHLPRLQTSFIGREPVLEQILALLRATRWLTLTGTGGAGKTRLALRAAESIAADFTDGIFYVDLTPLDDPVLIASTLTAALKLAPSTQQPSAAALAEWMAGRKLLIVLDNCEHLRTACAQLVADLLDAAPGLTVLATSREPLAAMGEIAWAVPLLVAPAATVPAEDLLSYDAVRLFLTRAQAVAPAFVLDESNRDAVAQICRLLEGIPLAIELAAARVALLTPQQIVERIQDSNLLLTRRAPDSDARHPSLDIALQWSYDLLAPVEQLLFVRLAVFAGTFTLDAVETVCSGSGIPKDQILDLLANLLDRSLLSSMVQGATMRYRLLIPIRHFAATLLQATGAESYWLQRLTDWGLQLARTAEPELTGPGQGRWLEQLADEHDNLRAALTWCCSTPEHAEAGLELACALGRFWCVRSHLVEGQRWLARLLPRTLSRPAPLHVQAGNILARMAYLESNFQSARTRYEQTLSMAQELEYDDGIEDALVGLANCLWELGDFPAARAQLEVAIAYCRELHHTYALARAINTLGLVNMYQGDHDAADAAFQESLLLNQQLGNDIGIAAALYNLAQLASQIGDYQRATQLNLDALHLNRELGNRATAADVLSNLGADALAVGELTTARAYYVEAQQIYTELGARGDCAYALAGLGEVAFYAEEYDAARTHFQSALALFRAAGNQRLIARVLGRLGRIACRTGDNLAAATLLADSLHLRCAIGHKAGMIFALDEGYVELAVATGRPSIALQLLGAAEAARQRLRRVREPVEVQALAPTLAQLREHAGELAATGAWAEGYAMSLDDATALALEALTPGAVSQLPAGLRICALGPLRIYLGDRLLTAADWTYSKARELVIYLLCHPNSTREQIGLAFWPDASPEQVRKRLSAALAHARNALGRTTNAIVFDHGRYRLAGDCVAWCDVDSFRSQVIAARRLLADPHARRQAIPILQEVMQLYQGDLAEDMADGAWCYADRAALLEDYLESLMTLARLHCESGAYEEAIRIYRCALTKDPYCEEAHHALIRCYSQLDRRSQALRQFDALTASLADLDVTPSPEIVRFAAHLRHNRAPLDIF